MVDADSIEVDDDAIEMEANDDNRADQAKRRAVKKKGRGFGAETRGNVEEYESLEASGVGPQRSKEGWIIFVTNIQEEAQEGEVYDCFTDFGEIKNINVNVDRRTGFLKGYAMIEYGTRAHAAEAIQRMDGAQFLGQTINVDWCFVSGSSQHSRRKQRR